VNVESDIVKRVHRVLQVSFLSQCFPRWSQHRSCFENPSSFHLYIHTDGIVLCEFCTWFPLRYG
jgi:hypothetical protein